MEDSLNLKVEGESNSSKIFNLILRDGKNVLLESSGGCGKSTIIKAVTKLLIQAGKEIYVTATTGCATLSLRDDKFPFPVTTLHRFMGCGLAEESSDILIRKIKSKPDVIKRWQNCEILIIDEISMLGATLFVKLDTIAKSLRESTLPFGGIKVIASGDFLQLKPVKDTWIFLCDEWKAMNFVPFVLTVPYRYDDMKFFEMLLRIRKGVLLPEDIKVIKSRVNANIKIHNILSTLGDSDLSEIIRPTMFYSRRIDVDQFNQQELEKLPGESITFIAKDEFTPIKGNPKLEEYEQILNEDIPKSIALKVGAQVMLKVNLDVDSGLVNGSRGVISEIITNEGVIVKFLNGKKIRIDLYTRIMEDKYAIVSRKQIPFILAWAMTIHKSQGSTLDYAIINLGPSIFTEGQAYVALSRCRSINGLFISEFLPKSIRADKQALEYVHSLEGV